MPSPRLLVRRVVVDGSLGLDLPLDPGLNVVYAEPVDSDPRLTNKAGKTGLVELVQHGLGRRQPSRREFHFAPISQSLERLWLSTELNDKPFTIQRSLRELTARLSVYEAPYSSELQSMTGDLVSVEDLSSVLLEKLGIPEVAAKKSKGELDPLTFPALMRTFVLHQDHSFGAILDKVQPESRRTDLIGFVAGIIPPQHFEKETELANLQTRMLELEGRYREVSAFLRSEDVPGVIEAQRLVSEAEQNLEDAQAERQAIQMSIRDATERGSSGGHIADLRERLSGARAAIVAREQELLGRERELERLRDLSGSLEADIRRLKRVQSSIAVLSTIHFEMCPRCLQEITSEMRIREEHGRCSLCSRDLRHSSDSPPRLAPRAPDIELQLEETKDVITNLTTQLQELTAEINQQRALERSLEAEIEAESRAYVSPSVDQLVGAANQVAAAGAELGRARFLLEHARAVQELLRRYEAARKEFEDFTLATEEHREIGRRRVTLLRELFVETLERFAYPNLESATIEGRTLTPIINGHYYYHAGAALTGLAVVAFHIALLRLSVAESTYFPRFLIIDSPAVGDLNEANHRHVLDHLAQLHNDALADAGGVVDDIPWQVILTTRRVTDAIEPFISYRISSKPGKMLLRQRR